MFSTKKILLSLAAIGCGLFGTACNTSTALPSGQASPGGGTGAPVTSGNSPSGGTTVQPTSCKDGFMLCGDGACQPSRWDFETGDVQGWGPSATSTATVAVTTSPKFDGQFALAGRNPTGNFDVTLTVPICGARPTNLTGKTITARYFLDFEVISKLKLGRTCLGYSSGGDFVTGSTCSDDLTPGWHEVSQVIDATASVTAIGVEVQMFSGSMYSSAGTVYVDDVSISN